MCIQGMVKDLALGTRPCANSAAEASVHTDSTLRTTHIRHEGELMRWEQTHNTSVCMPFPPKLLVESPHLGANCCLKNSSACSSGSPMAFRNRLNCMRP